MSKEKENFSDWKNEFKKGVNSTLPFLLSHHEPEEYNKCILVGKHYVCGRCFGIYFGLLIGFLFNLFFVIDFIFLFFVIYFFPICALMDWYFSNIKNKHSNNKIRFFSGFLLGFAFILAISSLLNYFFYWLISGMIYGILAIILLCFNFLKKRKNDKIK